MTIVLDFILRLTVWFLLTADLSPLNIVIGIVVCLLIPRSLTLSRTTTLRDWVEAIWQSVVAIPQAYIEAVEIMVRPHRYEDLTRKKVPPRRTPGLVFLDIFVITFTPKTIVTRYHKRGWYEVHWIRRRKPQ
ncbi:MAG: Na+/H+ antiporter subunit E [Cyanobacteria bacterium P01_F01_bin.153]